MRGTAFGILVMYGFTQDEHQSSLQIKVILTAQMLDGTLVAGSREDFTPHKSWSLRCARSHTSHWRQFLP